MQVYDIHAFRWNRACAPHGNLGRVDPSALADECDKNDIPWYTDGWPYASGIKAYCPDFNLWMRMIANATEKSS